MRRIGIIASNSTEMTAAVILNEGEEKNVKAEDLVLVKNRNGNIVLAVCRGGLGSNENLKTGAYSPGVAYARMGRHPSNAKEFYAFGLSIVGDVTRELEQNKFVIAPSSDVELFEESDNPMNYLGSSDCTIGYYKDMKSWKVPYDSAYIPYHVGVFGVTGSGKSFLARYQLIPVVTQSGFDAIVFDWKGSDYAPYYTSVVKLKDVYLDDEVVFSYLLSGMDYFGMTGERKYKNDAAEALEEVISEGDWRGKSAAEMRAYLEGKVVPIIEHNNVDSRGNVSHWGKLYSRKFKKGLRKLQDRDFENIMGKKTHEEILKLAHESHVLVMDLSEGSKEEKLSIFVSFARYLKGLMEKKQRVNVALLIDEGPQYCPWEPTGVQYETNEIITELCALGRTYGLCITLLSQGIAGEIGINAAVRRNLNTQFIGKIHPLDMQEAGMLLSQLDIDPKFLVTLEEGYFYFLGKMNPSPIPLLIHFDIEEGKTK
jgi:hypothetical protein